MTTEEGKPTTKQKIEREPQRRIEDLYEACAQEKVGLALGLTGVFDSLLTWSELGVRVYRSIRKATLDLDSMIESRSIVHVTLGMFLCGAGSVLLCGLTTQCLVLHVIGCYNPSEPKCWLLSHMAPTAGLNSMFCFIGLHNDIQTLLA